MGRPGPQGHRHRCSPRVLVHTLADENGAKNPTRISLEPNFLRIRDFGRDYTGDSRNLCANVNIGDTVGNGPIALAVDGGLRDILYEL